MKKILIVLMMFSFPTNAAFQDAGIGIQPVIYLGDKEAEEQLHQEVRGPVRLDAPVLQAERQPSKALGGLLADGVWRDRRAQALRCGEECAQQGQIAFFRQLLFQDVQDDAAGQQRKHSRCAQFMKRHNTCNGVAYEHSGCQDPPTRRRRVCDRSEP